MGSVRPLGADTRPADEPAAPLGTYQVQRTATNRRERERTGQEGIEHVLLPAGTLQVPGEGR